MTDGYHLFIGFINLHPDLIPNKTNTQRKRSMSQIKWHLQHTRTWTRTQRCVKVVFVLDYNDGLCLRSGHRLVYLSIQASSPQYACLWAGDWRLRSIRLWPNLSAPTKPETYKKKELFKWECDIIMILHDFPCGYKWCIFEYYLSGPIYIHFECLKKVHFFGNRHYATNAIDLNLYRTQDIPLLHFPYNILIIT